MTKSIPGRTAFGLVGCLAVTGVTASPDTDLREQVLALDAAFFEAFNTRDVATMDAMMADDLEFYHDKTGVTDHEENMASFRSLAESDTDLNRELLTTEVFPVPDFGAIQTGEHRFCHTTPEGETDCGTFRFMHLWREGEEGWQVARVVSYDH